MLRISFGTVVILYPITDMKQYIHVLGKIEFPPKHKNNRIIEMYMYLSRESITIGK